MWCVADLDEEYIAKMEDVLEVYERPYDPQQPVVCVDESRLRCTRMSVRLPRLRRDGKPGGTTNTSAVAQPMFSAR
jgi:hypothetical protein